MMHQNKFGSSRIIVPTEPAKAARPQLRSGVTAPGWLAAFAANHDKAIAKVVRELGGVEP